MASIALFNTDVAIPTSVIAFLTFSCAFPTFSVALCSVGCPLISENSATLRIPIVNYGFPMSYKDYLGHETFCFFYKSL